MNYGKHTKPAAIWQIVVADILLLAAALLTFSYFHHVRPVEGEAGKPIITLPPVVSQLPSNPDLPPELNSAVSGNESTEPDYSYLNLGEKFYDKFNLDNTVTVTENSYRSGRVSITLTEKKFAGAVCHVADIYLCDIGNYGTTFAKGKFGKNISESIPAMAERGNAILAVNGDYYGTHSKSYLVRNGMLYYDAKADDDICILYADGRMETYFENEFNKDAVTAQGPWQAWGFGPKLMEDGKALFDPVGDDGFSFNSSVKGKNPRTAIGYYEPGHYCLVMVDGRSDNSSGLSMNELAEFMESLGCTDAFNLDGGQTSMMIFNGRIIGEPYRGGRNCSDIISITDF